MKLKIWELYLNMYGCTHTELGEKDIQLNGPILFPAVSSLDMHLASNLGSVFCYSKLKSNRMEIGSHPSKIYYFEMFHKRSCMVSF